MKLEKQPKLTLVGAGPGDPELITIKGVKALSTADVVFYDALVNTELLEYAPKALKVFVGKRKGLHRYGQEEINELIVQYALKYGHVVRLKGGDPFIFGRGAEELDYAEKFNIQVEVISGISSSIAVPAHAGISLTKRFISESFWVITGTTSDGQLSEDISLAARSTATVVILMGMSKLKEILGLFKENNKAELPVAIIENGTTAYERSVAGTVSTISGKVEKKKISSPAIIVIGEVVRESHKLRSFFAHAEAAPHVIFSESEPKRIRVA